MIKNDKNRKQVKLNMVNKRSFQIQIKFNLIIFRNFLRPSNFRQLESASIIEIFIQISSNHVLVYNVAYVNSNSLRNELQIVKKKEKPNL